MADMESSWIQTIINWVLAVFAGLFSLIFGIGGYTFKRTVKQVDEIQKSYVRKEEVAAIDVKIATLVSRRELANHIRDLRDDKQRMHQENLDANKELRDELREMRAEQGEELRAVHQRVDEILRK